MPPKRYESWYAKGGILVRPSQLLIEVDEPIIGNTGIQPFYASSLDNVVGNTTTFTTDDEVIEGYNFLGIVQPRADNVTLRNCKINGYPVTTTPGEGTALVDCTHSLCTNFKIEWCDLKPQAPHWNWDSAIKGRHFTMRYCRLRECTDDVNIHVYTDGFTHVVMEQNLFENVAFWTGQTGGIVHPQDAFTHNDSIQHIGGRGSRIRGNAFQTYYKRQYGHWEDLGGGGAGTEPYVGIGINDLPQGAPRYGGPWVPGGDSLTWPGLNTLPDRGSGTEATGRYNRGSLSGLQIGRNLGASYELEVWGNWFYGSAFAINGGGNYYPGNNEFLGTFYRNRFSRDQGQQDIGGNFTHTINIDTDAEPGWNGHVDIPTTGVNRNYYMSDGAAITVRI